MIKFFKSLMLEITKEMKLNVAEYTLLMFIYNLRRAYETVTLTFSEFQAKVPFVIKRSQFDAAIKNLVEAGFIEKISDRRNVSYIVNDEMFAEIEAETKASMKNIAEAETTKAGLVNPTFEDESRSLRNNDSDLVESQKVPEAETGATDSEASEISCYELRNHMRNNTEIIPVSNDAGNINAPKSTDLIDLPVEVPKNKTKAKKVFEIPTIEEIAKHMYDFLQKKGISNLNPNAIYREAEKFFYYYNSKQWKVGKTTMKCWPSSASGWILRNDDLSKFQTDPRNMGLQEFQQVVNPSGFNFMFDFKKQQG